ncbi:MULTISPECIES: radical SAM protein [unclassified Pseudodesulfovibrio]|uniref:elongator complex protein 3 n=1 Tax=unclassified Pseudodesulfovibrio TaxID=2661612 RepID=UPI000FEBF1C5|nr:MULTISPECIES: radical SAM protein [unclassified Pseudodesulfovibrio]MCJ2165637.1 radical SAM protein [Pseudodesulfovibrio sp. S3-i]RWU03044.1 radical SAM protein [Pseudodesulfovibrio sp. S3]
MSDSIVFTHPEPTPTATRVWPVFLPFAGCPYRCAFCAQDKQTGRDEAALADILRSLESDLDQALARGKGPYEIAFYGGTFTALPEPWPETFLGLAARFRERGLISRVRCSTRPDCVSSDVLDSLRGLGLDMVELGIQSFDDAALITSSRGYAGEVARCACQWVKEAGLSLGVQLLPGLPGDRPGLFAADVRTAAALRPETIRLYPCMVIKGTPLAEIWKRGGFQPWSLDHAKQELAAALPLLWERNVRVIRFGLAPENSLRENILAGPWHPALGQSVRGLALLEIVRTRLVQTGMRPVSFSVPRRYQGELFGHKGELTDDYRALGLGRSAVRYTDESDFTLA